MLKHHTLTSGNVPSNSCILFSSGRTVHLFGTSHRLSNAVQFPRRQIFWSFCWPESHQLDSSTQQSQKWATASTTWKTIFMIGVLWRSLGWWQLGAARQLPNNVLSNCGFPVVLEMTAY